MENDDLADLLERELALLDDDDEDVGEVMIDIDFLNRRSNDEIRNTVIDEELEQLMLSANALPSLREQENISVVEAVFAEEPHPAHAAVDLQAIFVSDHVESPAAVELTEEEKEIIAGLMSLMIESVERCAPILERSTLPPLVSSVPVPLIPIEQLTIISDDSQIAIDFAPETVNLDTTNHSQTISLLDDQLLHETSAQQRAKIASSQDHDKVVWDETNRYKQTLELERARIEERQRRREEAKVLAQREKAAENIQRMARGHLSRRSTAPLRLQRYLALQQAEAEHQHQLRLQEEALRESKRLEELKSQRKEARNMGQNESQCRKVWEELKRIIESQRLAELQLMAMEDACGKQIRDAIAQAKAKLHNYAILAAQEDVEYDLVADSDSDISDTESVSEIDSEIPDTPRVDDNAETTTSTTNAIHHSSTAITSTSNTTNSKSNTTATNMKYKVAPPKDKPTAVVDPRQGRKFGGAFVNTTPLTTSTTSSGNSENQSSSGVGSKASRDGVTPLPHASSASGTNSTISKAVEEHIIHTPPMSAAERQTLESSWYSMVSSAYSSSAGCSVGYDASSVSRAESILSMCFGGGNSDSSGSANNRVGSDIGGSGSNSEIIHALHHWQQWTVEYAKIVADVNIFTTANTLTTTTNISTAANDTSTDSTDALHNTMLDMHTHPTLLIELDLCVEGITSTTFLTPYTNITKLTLNVNKITSLQGMHTLSQLVTLSLKDNKLVNIDALSTLHTLRYCYLDTNKITSLAPLNGLHSLSVLTANSNFICEMPVLQCSALSRLELCRNKICTIPAYSLRYLPNLTHLNLSSNQIHSVCGETLSMCSVLHTLILSENLLTQVPAPLRLPLLRNLRLNLNRIENMDVWVHQSENSGSTGGSITSTSVYPLFTPSLQKLVLSDNHLTSLHSSVFPMWPLLEELDLSFNTLPSKECLQGIEHCKLLSAIHLQDNLFTTVPVNTTGAAGTRTALPPQQLTILTHYLVDLCPTLDTVSGNRLDPKEFSERVEAVRNVYLRNHYLTHHTWLSPEVHIRDLAYTTHSEQVRTLLSVIQAHGVQQNLMIVKERAVKREEGNSKSKLNTTNTSGTADTAVKRDWEQENITMLNAQLTQMLNLYNTTTNAYTTDNTSNSSVFMSYAKSVPMYVDTNTTSPPPEVVQPSPIVYSMEYELEYMERDGSISGGSGISNVTSEISSGNCESFYFTQTNTADYHATPNTTTSVNTNTTSATDSSNNHTTHRAALQIQRHYRGHSLRRRLRTALQSITYHDTELDELFNSEYNDMTEYNDILDMSYLDEPVMVYGDHIRKRSRPNTGTRGGSSAGSDSGSGGIGMNNSSGVATSTDNWVLPQDNNNPIPARVVHNVKAGSGLNNINTNTHYGGGYGASAESSRPDTGLSAHSIDAPDRAAQSLSGASSPAHSMLSARSGLSGLTDAPPHSARSRVTASQLGQEWGISDPRVQAAMVKRSNKLRAAENIKERRELEKDPLYRLQQFQKSAQKTSGATVQPANTRTSGSFGGAPKTMRGAGGNSKRKNLPLPAWMLGQNGQEGEES